MEKWLKFGLISVGILLHFISLIGYDIMNSPSIDGYFLLMIIYSAIFWFIVGAIIGLISKKLKDKK